VTGKTFSSFQILFCLFTKFIVLLPRRTFTFSLYTFAESRCEFGKTPLPTPQLNSEWKKKGGNFSHLREIPWTLLIDCTGVIQSKQNNPLFAQKVYFLLVFLQKVSTFQSWSCQHTIIICRKRKGEVLIAITPKLHKPSVFPAFSCNYSLLGLLAFLALEIILPLHFFIASIASILFQTFQIWHVIHTVLSVFRFYFHPKVIRCINSKNNKYILTKI